MSIPTPPEPKTTAGPLERVDPTKAKPAQKLRYSHQTPEGYRVWVDEQGRPVKVERPLSDNWVWG